MGQLPKKERIWGLLLAGSKNGLAAGFGFGYRSDVAEPSNVVPLPVVDRRPRPLDLSAGRRFACKRSGRCCRQDGSVFVTDEELEGMAEMLGLTPHEFRAKYRVRRDPRSQMRFFDAENGRGCPLLTQEGRCSVHERKPAQCSSWPFWPEMIDDEAEWVSAKKMCPGMDVDDGHLYSQKEISDIRALAKGTADASRPFDGGERSPQR